MRTFCLPTPPRHGPWRHAEDVEAPNRASAVHWRLGHRRLLGARQVVLPKVPVRVRELNDEVAARFALWENLARRDLDAMDVADSVDGV